MRLVRCAFFTIAAVMAAAPSSWAQDARALQVTPYAALGTGGVSPVGAMVTFPVTSQLSIEGDVGYRHNRRSKSTLPEQDLNGISTNASVLWSLPRIGRLTPYLAAGFGTTYYRFPAFREGVLFGSASRLGLRSSVGGGVSRRISDRLELRTDARWFIPAGTSAGMEPYDRGHFRLGAGLGISID